jgi:tight adherence protein B
MGVLVPVLLTFAVVLAVFALAYWALLGRPEAVSQRRLRKRLAPVRDVAPETTGLIERPTGNEERPVEALVARTGGGLVRRLAVLLERADMDMGPGALLGVCVATAAAGALLLARLSPAPMLAMPLGLAAGFLPIAFVKMKGERRTAKFEEQFPEAIDLMARALRAGHALTTGLALVAEELPEPCGSEFRLVYDRQSFGMPLPDALRLFAERVPLLDARFFVTAVLTQRESGGNLAEILDNLGSVIRQRFRVKRQIKVVTAHARLTGWVLVAMPVAIALGMVVVAPDHILTLVRDPLGVQMGLAAISLWGVGFLVIRRLIDVEY